MFVTERVVPVGQHPCARCVFAGCTALRSGVRVKNDYSAQALAPLALTVLEAYDAVIFVRLFKLSPTPKQSVHR